MALPQVIQGSWQEIESHAAELKHRDDLILIVPAHEERANGAGSEQNLLELMKDYIGSANYGNANLSEDTSGKFARLIAEDYRRSQQ